jgi:hypothetical protein
MLSDAPLEHHLSVNLLAESQTTVYTEIFPDKSPGQSHLNHKVKLISRLEKRSGIDQVRQSIDFIPLVKLDAITLDKSLPLGPKGFYQEYRPETAPLRQTAYHSIVPPTARI